MSGNTHPAQKHENPNAYMHKIALHNTEFLFDTVKHYIVTHYVR